MAFAYDCLKILRIVFKCGPCLIWAQDICYWVCCSYTIYKVLLEYNFGDIRWYAFVGLGLGMLTYSVTIGNIFVRYLLKALKILYKPIKIITSRFKFSKGRKADGTESKSKIGLVKRLFKRKTKPKRNGNKASKSDESQ